MIALASGANITISGCADAESYCKHEKYGGTVQQTCPATCGSCRRLADAKEFSNLDTNLFYP